MVQGFITQRILGAAARQTDAGEWGRKARGRAAAPKNALRYSEFGIGFSPFRYILEPF